MEHHPRLTSGTFEDHVGIPEDLRCKRSDGKQWRCSAMSMPDKTVCEKHYIQAKKRAANSALRASMKKAKRKSYGDSDDYFDSKNDEEDTPPMSIKGDFSASVSGKKHKDKVPKSHVKYSSESPPMGTYATRNPLKPNDDEEMDIAQFDENRKSSYKSPPPSAMESSRNRSQKSFDTSAHAENSDESTESSYDAGGLTCHQCQRNDRGRVVWCLRCDKRGYCDNCVSKCYPDIPLDEIQKVCPACRGTCTCKLCLRGDNLIKVRIREIGVSDKLQYLYSLLSSILPVVKHIHFDQCFELELETKLHGTKADVPRAKLHADEQMCCNCCRIPIIDYHRHCTNCLYDLCLTCCRDLRQESLVGVKEETAENQMSEKNQEGATITKQLKSSKIRLNLTDLFPDWRANSDGSIPCPPKESGGCGCPSLSLRRIFKLNWVAKLVKNVEEMANGCKVCDDNQHSDGSSDSKLYQFAHREESNDNSIYCPASQDVKIEGISTFKKHWVRGEPVLIKQVCDCTSCSSWDPMVIWRGIRETTDEKTKDDNRIVKAIDCLDCREVDIELGQFIKGYSEGRIHEDGWPEMLKLKDWPSPSASEEFLLYQRPDFVSKLPLLEFIHSKWGLLNVAARLPHYSLQNDVGPKIFISYGTYEELGRGDSVTNLQTNMRDMVYLLMHTFEVKLKGWQRTKIEKIQRALRESEAKEPLEVTQLSCGESGKSPDVSPKEHCKQNECSAGLATSKDEIMEDQVFSGNEVTSGGEGKEVDSGPTDNDSGDDVPENAPVGAIWDVFRRQDVPKLIQYLMIHLEEFRQPASLPSDPVMNPLFDKVAFLNRDHKRKLKDEFGIEPWTFEQRLGEAVFIPAGCPFQVRNLQIGFPQFCLIIRVLETYVPTGTSDKLGTIQRSSVQLALDFLSPESLGESVRLAEEIRCLPNDHEAKLQILEVGKMSLYAASSAIREVQKLALDPKSGLGFEDPNLTAMVSENLEKLIKRRQIPCA